VNKSPVGKRFSIIIVVLFVSKSESSGNWV
jgi:hypothetical protein